METVSRKQALFTLHLWVILLPKVHGYFNLLMTGELSRCLRQQVKPFFSAHSVKSGFVNSTTLINYPFLVKWIIEH